MQFLTQSILIGLVLAALALGILLAFAIPPWQLIVVESILLLLLGIWLLFDNCC